MSKSSPETTVLNDKLKHFHIKNGEKNFLYSKEIESYVIENTKIDKENGLSLKYEFEADVLGNFETFFMHIDLKLGDKNSKIESNTLHLKTWAQKKAFDQHLLRKFLEDAEIIILHWAPLKDEHKIVLLKSILPFLESNINLFPNFTKIYHDLTELFFKLAINRKSANSEDKLNATERFLNLCMSDRSQDWFDQKKDEFPSREKEIKKIAEKLKESADNNKKAILLKKARAWLLSRYDLETASKISFPDFTKKEKAVSLFQWGFIFLLMLSLNFYLMLSRMPNPDHVYYSMIFQFCLLCCCIFLIFSFLFFKNSQKTIQKIFLYAPEFFAFMMLAGIFVFTKFHQQLNKTTFISYAEMFFSLCVLFCYLPIIIIPLLLIKNKFSASDSPKKLADDAPSENNRHYSAVISNTQILLPRLIAGITAGYFLLLADESWKGLFQGGLAITDMSSFDLKLALGRFFVPLLAVFAYIFIEMKNVSGIQTGNKPLRLFSRAFSYSIFIGIIISDIFGKGLCSLKNPGDFGVPGLLGNIYIEVLVYLAPLALFIGIFLQLLWDDKKLTDKI